VIELRLLSVRKILASICCKSEEDVKLTERERERETER